MPNRKQKLRPGLVYLNSLPVLFEDVHPHHSFVELWIQWLDDFIIKMLLQMQKKKKGHEVACAHMNTHEHSRYREDAQAAYLILQSIKAFEDELKHGVQVVRARWGYKDIRVAVKKNNRKSLKTIGGDIISNICVILRHYKVMSVPKSHSSSNSQPQCCRFASTACSSQSHGAPQGLLWDGFNKLQHCLGLEDNTRLTFIRTG